MMPILLRVFFLVCVCYWVCDEAGAQTEPLAVPADADSLYKHDPYDLSQVTVVDSTDVYETRVNHLLRLPRYAWTTLVYPLGEFTIYAEHAKLWVQYYELFTNKDGTFGLFPQWQFGGETGTGGGARIFHTNLFGRRKIFTAHYVYSGNRGQFGEGLYVDPNFAGKGLIWKIEGGYLQTENEGANINTALDEVDDFRRFELKQINVETSFEWRLNKGRIASFVPQLKIGAKFGFSQRDLRPILGGFGRLTDLGSTPQARIVKGLGTEFSFYRFGLHFMYDSRDYKKPVNELSHPLNYRFPGRVVAQFDEQFYFARDVGYPERGGFIALEGELATGSDGVKFWKAGAEAARYFTLFWKDRILALRARLDKVRSIDGGFVPYTDLVQMGGNESARGYKRGYFRGQGALQFNAEYRYPIWDYWNAFLFWDEGQIFDHFDGVTWDDFHSSWGGGITFRSEVGLLAKIKFGHSAVNDLLIGFTVRQSF